MRSLCYHRLINSDSKIVLGSIRFVVQVAALYPSLNTESSFICGKTDKEKIAKNTKRCVV